MVATPEVAVHFDADDAHGVQALLVRAIACDSQCSVRFRTHDENTMDVFVTTPFDTVASRRCAGYVTGQSVEATATSVLDVITGKAEEITPTVGYWPGGLPPATGYTVVDILPVTVVRHLADQGVSLAKQFSGPMGPPASLLDQVVIDVSGEEGATAKVDMRMVFSCTSLNLIPGPGAPLSIPRQARVSIAGSWVRLDAPYGTIYRATSTSVLSLGIGSPLG